MFENFEQLSQIFGKLLKYYADIAGNMLKNWRYYFDFQPLKVDLLSPILRQCHGWHMILLAVNSQQFLCTLVSVSSVP